ncbi:MAG: hypothetical protein ABWK04_03340 [Hydrogenobacter sp.]
MEGLKKRLEIEQDRFKVFLSLASVVVGGFVGLLFRERDAITTTLMFLGLIVALFSFGLAIKSFFQG